MTSIEPGTTLGEMLAALGLPQGHPVHTFLAENRVAAGIMSRLRSTVEDLGRSVEVASPVYQAVRADVERLADVERHYLRKENQLFPLLERHGIIGPPRLMWVLHDDIRTVFKEFRQAAEGGDRLEALRLVPQILTMMEDMIYKEEKILYPTSLENLSAEEWDEIKSGEQDIGYSWAEEVEVAAHSGRSTPLVSVGMERAARSHAATGSIALTTGALTPDRLDLVLRNLPFDITVVDENDRVLYYSEGERVFSRSPAVIGREVRNCHPPTSVHRVEQILEEFRDGSQSRADFWIEVGGRFVVIRYFALRDQEGTYKGVLEVVQDATGVRGLEGQRRLLDW